VLLLNECLLLFISLSTQSGNFWIHPRIRVLTLIYCRQKPTSAKLITLWIPHCKKKKRNFFPRISLNIHHTCFLQSRLLLVQIYNTKFRRNHTVVPEVEHGQIRLGGLSKAMRNLSHDGCFPRRHSNPTPQEYEAEVAASARFKPNFVTNAPQTHFKTSKPRCHCCEVINSSGVNMAN
jgi:hypothetical protein